MKDFFSRSTYLIILAIALLVFGPSRLPELGKGLGKSLKDFKDTMDGAGDKIMKEVGVTPEDARKMSDSLQAVKRGNLQRTLTSKAMEHTGLDQLSGRRPAADTPATAAATQPDASPAPSDQPPATTSEDSATR